MLAFFQMQLPVLEVGQSIFPKRITKSKDQRPFSSPHAVRVFWHFFT